MGLLVNGQWTTDWYQPDINGKFVRPPTQFRQRLSTDGTTPFREEPNRYHLYVSLACPWAHRALIMRKLRKLEEVVGLSIVDPVMGNDGWAFSNHQSAIPDTVNHCRFLREVYLLADPQYTGRVTVPVLWDKQRQTIVNNESLDVMRMFDTQFEEWADSSVQFYPDDLQPQIDAMIDENYHSINNGVYKCGFATTQEAYDQAIDELRHGLERCEKILSQSRYLCGDVLTEADWCLFTTLVR
ncbi:MAG: glutathione S-transferase C-terminal domain-containing protein, partial [Candidatus Omnitrophica bacterium]|nr:glutathione S-transferase C-terminal domain-containing protein [Candidatus Omnitrophota bacterium]